MCSFFQELFPMGHSQRIFLYFHLYYTVNSKMILIKIAGFESGTSGVGSNHSANCATTTAQVQVYTSKLKHDQEKFCWGTVQFISPNLNLFDKKEF